MFNLIALIFLLLLYAIIYFAQFFSELSAYPPGPTPLPIIGNILITLKNLNKNPYYTLSDLSQKYGSVYTFWLGSQPIVIVTDSVIAKSIFYKPELSDRIDQKLLKNIKKRLFNCDNMLALTQYGDEYKMLRTFSTQSLKKFLSTPKLPEIVYNIVGSTVDQMIEKECGKAFPVSPYITNLVIQMLAFSAFGSNHMLDENTSKRLVNNFEILQKHIIFALLSEYVRIPGLNYFLKQTAEETATTSNTIRLFESLFANALKAKRKEINYESFCEFIVSCKDDKNDQKNYLNDSNLVGVLIALFFAGADTTHYTLEWILLFMSYYPEMQQRMREEVAANIGSQRSAQIEDRVSCNFMYAFICETIRYRYVVPAGLFHMSTTNTEINGINIPKATIVLQHHLFLHNDPKYWTDPHVFSPERFLHIDGHFCTTHLSAFAPFGSGKRKCIGDQFSKDALFLVITRLLQKTNGYQFLLSERRQSSILEPKTFGFFLEPKSFSLILQRV